MTVFQNLFPARGRKPWSELETKKLATGSFSEPIPRKGTETVYDFLPFIFIKGFSEPIPRKGTETLLISSRRVTPANVVFQNLFPARGRKQSKY